MSSLLGHALVWYVLSRFHFGPAPEFFTIDIKDIETHGIFQKHLFTANRYAIDDDSGSGIILNPIIFVDLDAKVGLFDKNKSEIQRIKKLLQEGSNE